MKKCRYAIVYILSVTFFSCKTNTERHIPENTDFIENIIDFQIRHKDNNLIELSNIYDSLVTDFLSYSSERLILGKALEKRGFKIISWERGNYPPLGPRIISMKLKRDGCFCEVNKIYYSTTIDTLFRPSETLRCTDSLSISQKTK